MKFKRFYEWLKYREMCGTFVVGPDPKVKHQDFQVWGAPGSTLKNEEKPRRKKHRKTKE